MRRSIVGALARALRRFGLQLVKIVEVDPDARSEGRIWPVHAHTMIGLRRLDNLQCCVQTVLEDRVPGDLIEAGVWRGGASIFMRAILAAYGVSDRRVFLADSFSGLPRPDAATYPPDAGDRHYVATFLRVSRDEVDANFRLYGLLDEQVVFLDGWFKDTLPAAPIDKLAVVRIDADMYESTWEALTHLYPRLSIGGYCIVDDYAMNACRQAVQDFRVRSGIRTPIHQIDWTGVYWRKDAESG